MKFVKLISSHRTIVCFITISLMSGYASQGWAHDKDSHAVAKAKIAGEVKHFDVENLRIPDVPVVDTRFDNRGFVSRFAGAGTVVISLTYTGCETLCPISNVILQQLDKALQEDDAPAMQIVTLSIDPERDTPDALRATAQSLQSSQRWTWLTASTINGRMLLDSLDIDRGALEEHDPIFLVGNVSTGRFIRVIGMPDPDQLLVMGRTMSPL